MKTYEQALHAALLQGAHSLFGGGTSIYVGAHSYLNAICFIYGKNREEFLDDYEVAWETVSSDGTLDEVIRRIEEKM